MGDINGRIARRISKLGTRLSAVERSAQSAYRSVESGTIEVNDADGNPVAAVGQLTDGTVGVVDLITHTPVAPTTPDAAAMAAAISVIWDGGYVDDQPVGVTIAYIGVHLNQDPDDPDFEPTVESEAGQITIGGGSLVLGGDPGVETAVQLVAVSAAGIWSDPTDPVIVLPQYVISHADIPHVPPPPTEEPADAPVVTVAPFAIGSVLPTWEAVDNADWYNVYASLTTGFDSTDPANLAVGHVTGLRALVATIGGIQIPLDGTPVYVVVKAANVVGEGPPSTEVSATARQADVEFLSALYAWFGTVEAQNAMFASLDVLVSISTDGAINIGPRMTLNVPNMSDGTGGFTVWANDEHTGKPLIQLHPLGSYIDATLTAEDLTVLQALRLLGASALASGASMFLENGIADPGQPTLSQGLILTNWPAIPAGYAEKGIAWDPDRGQWWQLLWRSATNIAYVRTINPGGSAGSLVALAAVPNGQSVANSLTYWSDSLYTVIRGTDSGVHYWSQARFSLTGTLLGATRGEVEDTSPASVYPAMCTDGTNLFATGDWSPGDDYLELWVNAGTTSPNFGPGTSHAVIDVTAIPDVVKVKSLRVSAFDRGTQLLQISTWSGNVYHFTMATFGTVLSPPTLAPAPSHDFTLDNVSAWLDYVPDSPVVKNITAKAATLSAATLTSAGHGFAVGEVVTVDIGDPTFDGCWTITGVTTNTFTYSRHLTSVSTTATTGTATMGIEPGFYSSKSDSKLAAYSNYFASAGEKVYTKYLDLSVGGISTAASLISAGLAVAARRFVSVALNALPDGVDDSAVFVGYGTTPPADTDLFRRVSPEVIAGRAMVLTEGKILTGAPLQFTVTNRAVTGGTTATLDIGAHSMVPGQVVSVSGVPTDAYFNGTWLLTAVTSTTISFAITTQTDHSTASVGAVVRVNGLGGTPSKLFDGFGNSWTGRGIVDLPGLKQLELFNGGIIEDVTLTSGETAIVVGPIAHGCDGTPVVVGTMYGVTTSKIYEVKTRDVDATNFELIIQVDSSDTMSGQVRDIMWTAVVPR